MYDGEYQTLDAQSLRNWGQSSAYFNGPAVRVELFAGSSSYANGIRISQISAGMPPLDLLAGPSGICDTDDRVASSDKRVARLFKGWVDPLGESEIRTGCETQPLTDSFDTGAGTAFIIDIPTTGTNQRLHATVGHAWPNYLTHETVPPTILQFNVPASVGQFICHPGICDQFPIDRTVVIHVPPLGTTDDYAVFRCLNNDSVQCSPSQTTYEYSEFQAFPLGPKPPIGAGVRITGYGQDLTNEGVPPPDPEDPGDQCFCDTTACTSTNSRTQQVAEGEVIVVSDPNYPEHIHFDVVACNGNSGSPLSAAVQSGTDLGAVAVGILGVDKCADEGFGFNAALPFTHKGLHRAICHLADYGTNDVSASGGTITIVPGAGCADGDPGPDLFALRVTSDPRETFPVDLDRYVQSDGSLGVAPHYAAWSSVVEDTSADIRCGCRYAVDRVCDDANTLHQCIENTQAVADAFVEPAACRYLRIYPCCNDVGGYKVVGDSSNPDVDCVDKFVQADGQLGSTPFYGPWNNPEVLVYGAEIFSGAQYNIVRVYPAGIPANHVIATVEPWLWGDTDNSGVVDIDDLVRILSAIVGDFTGIPFHTVNLYVCEPQPCPEEIGLEDLIGLLGAFDPPPNDYEGPFPCQLPFGPGSGGGEGPSGGLTQCTISLEASPKRILSGGTATVEARIECPQSLRGYQIAVEVIDGTAGELSLESLTIDVERTDHCFFGLSHVPAADLLGARVVDALFGGGATCTPSKYAGTFVYRASTDASGVFTVSLRPNDTRLRDVNVAYVDWESGGNATVSVTSP